ncbi:MAG: hypothetical protein KC466_03050 [Myxococcales bacterium]|nr:hypothetical protein [Myxococcales bacterium]
MISTASRGRTSNGASRGRWGAVCFAAGALVLGTAGAARAAPVDDEIRALILRSKELYRLGAPDLAIEFLERVHEYAVPATHPFLEVADRAREAVDRVRAHFYEGINYYNRGAVPRALGAWEDVLTWDAKLLGDRPSVYSAYVTSFWAQEVAYKAEEGFHAGEYEQAYVLWQRVRRIDPESPSANAGLQRLERVADTFYKDGYALQEINPTEAKNRWRRVLAILPPDHPLYQKTKRRLLDAP